VVTITMTLNLQRHVDCPACEAPPGRLGDVLAHVFARNPKLRGYVLDDQGAVRHHVVVFINGRTVSDREQLTDTVHDGDEVFITQALSGG
jgi:sulfur carrier protein ThiS